VLGGPPGAHQRAQQRSRSAEQHAAGSLDAVLRREHQQPDEHVGSTAAVDRVGCAAVTDDGVLFIGGGWGGDPGDALVYEKR
jgi:hypothetical protein